MNRLKYLHIILYLNLLASLISFDYAIPLSKQLERISFCNVPGRCTDKQEQIIKAPIVDGEETVRHINSGIIDQFKIQSKIPVTYVSVYRLIKRLREYETELKKLASALPPDGIYAPSTEYVDRSSRLGKPTTFKDRVDYRYTNYNRRTNYQAEITPTFYRRRVDLKVSQRNENSLVDKMNQVHSERIASSNQWTEEKADILRAIDELKTLTKRNSEDIKINSNAKASNIVKQENAQYDDNLGNHRMANEEMNDRFSDETDHEKQRMYMLIEDNNNQNSKKRQEYSGSKEGQTFYHGTEFKQQMKGNDKSAFHGLIDPLDLQNNTPESKESILETIESLKLLLSESSKVQFSKTLRKTNSNDDLKYSQKSVSIGKVKEKQEKIKINMGQGEGSNVFINEDGKAEYVGADKTVAIRDVKVGGEQVLIMRG